ncbi:MAG TPA: VOC family protein [Verrucomicrobiae bacterium]|nr:VOC family protein [Verrucomicrobiae bacterium]
MRTGVWVFFAMAFSFAVGMAIEAARASAAGNDDARVTGIGGVFFKARDPRKLADWYRQHLGIGFQAAGNSDAAPMYSSFEWREKDDPKQLGSTAYSIFPQNTKYFDPSQAPFMINYRVTNLERVLAKLKADGATVDPKVEDEPYGKFGWAMDPEGNRFELWEPKTP